MAGAATREAGEGLRSTRSTALAAGPEAKQGRAGSEVGWDTWAFPEVRQEAER